MILAIYSKYKTNDKWVLHSVAKNIQAAQEEVSAIIKSAKIVGYDNVDATIQSFDCFDNVPGELKDDKVMPEKMLWS